MATITAAFIHWSIELCLMKSKILHNVKSKAAFLISTKLIHCIRQTFSIFTNVVVAIYSTAVAFCPFLPAIPISLKYFPRL